MVQQVKLERIARGIKSYEMAQRLGYNPALWSFVEAGKREPPVDVAHKAAEILGKPIAELFRDASV